jgi:hypothetical protein
VSSNSCIYKSQSGHKHAKLELKEQADNEERQKNNALVMQSIASIASSQAGMFNLMQLNGTRKNLKMLKEKYTAYKQFDREKAMTFLSDIDVLENAIINFNKPKKEAPESDTN